MPNQINLLSPTFRDFLLTKNIIADTISSNSGLNAALQGIGLPITQLGSPSPVVLPSDDILIEGVFHRDLNIVLNKYQGSSNDYSTVSINYLPGNTNSTIGGQNWNNEPYNINAADLNLASNDDRKFVVTKNVYLDVDKQVEAQINYKVPTYQMGSYLDENGNLNLGGPSTEAYDLIGSALQGGGIGFDPNGGGAVADFDVRSSLAGRILTATGAINDTRLGRESVGYLAAAIGNNIAFNIQDATLGRVNLDPFSLIKGNSLIVPNYKITVKDGPLGAGVDLLERMSGFKVPFSLLNKEASIFVSDTGEIGNIKRANDMIKNTGKGQILAMFANINANTDPKLIGKRGGYAPTYEDERTERGFNKEPLNAGEVYAYAKALNQNGGVTGSLTKTDNSDFDDLQYKDISFNNKTNLRKYPEDLMTKFAWSDTELNKTGRKFYTGKEFTKKKSILYKTQELFNSGNVKTLITGKGDGNATIKTNNEIQTGVVIGASSYFSKGSGVRSGLSLKDTGTTVTNPEDIFCRTWTTFDRYNQVQDLQKHSGLLPKGKAPNRAGENNVLDSVLENNGFVRIAPTVKNDGSVDIKRFMFSIENLAWTDNLTKLLPCEQGPGDPLSGHRGRIMWFPPYDISFNESVSVNWEKTNFIGRGEPIHTYNNTERTGTLSWKIIIDHPNIVNYFPKDWSNDEVASFFAGCLEIDAIKNSILSQEEKNTVEKAQNTTPVEKVDDQKPPEVTFSIFFPNDSSTINLAYENGLDKDNNPIMVSGTTTSGATNSGLGTTTGEGTVAGDKFVYPDNTNFGFNAKPIVIDGVTIERGINDSGFTSTLATFITDKCKYCKVDIIGYASTQGNQQTNAATNTANNEKLSINRANSVKEYIKSLITNDELAEIRYTTSGKGEINVGTGCDGVNGQDRQGCKEARKVDVKIFYDASLKTKAEGTTPPTDSNTNLPQGLVDILSARFFTECHYFKKLEQGDKFTYDKFVDKIKYFQPAFHSITPEGFNSRLTFLHQCTRQGPTFNNDKNPNNLAFGRPPVCILRIGDFYHTKIVIDSLNIDYEPLVWDLNPEGIGVQPMIANVSINFSFIGGSSLNGPINKLQNAITHNFYANTEIYEPRADKIQIENSPKTNGSNAYGKIVEGKYPDDDEFKPKTSSDEGLNNNANEVDKNQAAEAEAEANKAENTQESQKSNDVKILTDAYLDAYNGADFKYSKEISDVRITITDFDPVSLNNLSDGWSYKTFVLNNNQIEYLTSGNLKDRVKEIDGVYHIDIYTGLGASDMDGLSQKYDTNRSLKTVYEDEGSPVELECFSATTDVFLEIPYVFLGVELFKEGEETITKQDWFYLYTCDANVDNFEIKNYIAGISNNNGSMAHANAVGCLKC